MKKIISSTMAGLLLGASAGAMAEELKGVYLGGSATGYFFDDDRFVDDADDDATVLGVNLGYRFANPLALEIGYGHSAGGVDMDTFKLDAYYYITRFSSGWAPYFVLGYTNYNFDDDFDLADGDDSVGQMDAGFGVSKTWADSQWEFRGDGRFLERMGSGDQATDLALTLAVNYYFEKPPAPAPVAAPEPEPAPPPTRTISVKLNVLFEFDKAEVQAIYGDELAAIANAMKAHSDIVLALEGHTDSMGSDTYNQDLSLRRVQAVKARLVSDYGIPGDRITTTGFGESRPVADNATADGRAQNRRVIGDVTFTEIVK